MTGLVAVGLVAAVLVALFIWPGLVVAARNAVHRKFRRTQ